MAGLPARRATTLLYAIENQTAQLLVRSQKEAAWYLTTQTPAQREQIFLQALSAGRERPVDPGIAEIERYSSEWKALVPPSSSPVIRAAVARLLSNKYAFTRAAVPGIRAALELDDQEVQSAYRRIYGEPLEEIYAPSLPVGLRLRTWWSSLAGRLESLPPFWLAFVLTLPVGPGLLALPIALADLSLGVSVTLLILFGIVNMLTVAALAEATARSEIIRFGRGYLGQLVSDYLGDVGSLFLSFILFVDNLLVLIVFYLGVAGTLEGATQLPSELWLVGVFGAGIYFLSRKSLNTTLAASILIVTVNVVLLIALPLLVLPYFEPQNLNLGGSPADSSMPINATTLQLVFGVMLTNYFSHLLVANYGRPVIRRDPSARSWIHGSVAAIVATTVISCLWVVSISGALSPATLAAETGTVLAPLAGLVGPVFNVLGTVFVVLSLGLATVHISLGTFYLVQERLASSSLRPVQSERGRMLLSMAPVVLVFLVAEWLDFTGSGSFAGLLAFVGVVALPLLGGIYPVLLLASSRRKGDYVPGVRYRLLGHPLLLGLLYLLFLSSLFVYGLLIWESTIERVVTLLAALLILAATALMLRRGALDGRAVVEVREDQSDEEDITCHVTVDGRPYSTEVTVDQTDAAELAQTLASLTGADLGGEFQLRLSLVPRQATRELKVWVHEVTAQGNSIARPAKITVSHGKQEVHYELDERENALYLPVPKGIDQLELRVTLTGGD